MTKLSFLFLIFFAISTALLAQESEVTLKTATGDIYGTLLLPESKEKVPVVLIIAGSGPTDRNGNNPMMKNNSLKMLAECLKENGIASLRYDKRGIAQSAKSMQNERDIRLENYINDAKEWVDFLKKENRFSALIVAGHSEGSLIGMRAAVNNPNVSKYISIAGMGENMGIVLKKQLLAQPQGIRDLAYPIIDTLMQGDTVTNVSPFLFSLFRPSVQPYLISCFKYYPAQEIGKLKIPVLILQGTTDIQVSIEDADMLSQGNPKAEKHLIEGMNHVLKDCTSSDRNTQLSVYSDPDLPLNKELCKIITDFIKR